MTYPQAIDHLYRNLPMFSRVGAAAYKEDLYNTISLCRALGDPQQQFKSIHIAGTNGKGSTSHMLAALLQQAGYTTGLYTSPHLKDFRERIRINGQMIPEAVVAGFVERTITLTEAIQPSFFELTVAMAFEYFADQQVDIAVIETGLGGRLDSTNIINPILSIITNIGYDHMNILGNSLESIAAEKAGIIKPGVPVVIGEYGPVTKPIFTAKALECNSPIYFASDIFAVSDIQYTDSQLSCNVTDTLAGITETFQLDLNGLYQVKNLCTVLCAEGILYELGYPVKNADEKKALQQVQQLTGLHGRWEVLREQPALVLDVAHNEDGIKKVLEQVSGSVNNEPGRSWEKVHLVMGMVSDKEVEKVLSLLPAEAHYYFTNAHIPRALPHDALREKAATIGLKGDSYTDVNTAIASALKNAAADHLVLVCGSVYLVGEVEAGLFV